MEDFPDFRNLLDDVQPTSKDGKSLKTAFMSFLEDFPKQLLEMFQSMKEDNLAKDQKISSLETTVADLTRRVSKLEENVDDQEAYERRDTLVISGKKLPQVSQDENCPLLVQKIVSENLGLVISPQDISVSHRIGAPARTQRPDQRKIIVKFCRRDTKSEVLRAARRVKPSDIYLNESLTPQRQIILSGLRKAKRDLPNIVSGATSIEGSVYAWVKPPNPNAQGARDLKVKINTMTKFEDFCSKTLRTPASQLMAGRTLT